MTCFKLSPCLSTTTTPPHTSSSLRPTFAQPGDNSELLGLAVLVDNAVNADDDGVTRSHEGKSCEDDEEGHLIYHVGLVMKGRCT